MRWKTRWVADHAHREGQADYALRAVRHGRDIDNRGCQNLRARGRADRLSVGKRELARNANVLSVSVVDCAARPWYIVAASTSTQGEGTR